MDRSVKTVEEARGQAWHGFKPGPWQSRINVRDFIQRNYTPYEGDAAFLAGATERKQKVWETLLPAARRGGKERRAGGVAGAVEHSRPCPRLHR
jgi:pyruvate-formate lyase